MKYIDAEKLIKSVNNYREGARAALNPIDGDADYYTGKIDACEDIKDFIDSLQQEQPDFPTTDEEVEKFLATHPKVEVPDKYKTPDWLFKKLEQEQPEVDIVTEYDEQFDSDPVYGKLANRNAGIAIARHFYELGLNARKEE
ncbi:MAG: hypothetical protein J5382_10085 [Bacteroidales bacterium]|nr:hypothetical protein [Bacteroidales bacterium]